MTRRLLRCMATLCAISALAAFAGATVQASPLTRVVAKVHEAPPPAMRSLAALVFPTPSIGYAAGSGSLLATHDGGRSWVAMPPPLPDVSQLAFATARSGWALGSGRLAVTDDGGRMWRLLPKPPVRIAALGALAGLVYATTDEAGTSEPGPLIVSANGGRGWHRLSTPVPVQAACFASPSRGWILGATNVPRQRNAAVFRTSDSGANWHKVLSVALSGESFDPGSGRLACAGPGRVWAEIDGSQGMSSMTSAIWASADGGHTWRELAATPRGGAGGPPPGPVANVPAVPASSPGLLSLGPDGSGYVLGLCVACEGTGTYVLGGTTGRGPWRDAGQVGTPAVASGPLGGFTVLAPAVAVVALNWNGSMAEILETRNVGRTWHVVWRAFTPGPTGPVAFVSATHGYGLGSPDNAAAWYETKDGGRTWRRVGTVSGMSASGFGAFPGAQVVRAEGETVWIGSQGRLIVTDDGGRTWRTVHAAWAGAAARATAFVGATGCAGPSVTGAFWRTSDGGRSWSRTNGHASAAQCAAALKRTALPIALNGAGAQSAAVVGPTAAWMVAFRPPLSNRSSGWSLLETADAGRHWRRVVWPEAAGDVANASVGAVPARVVWITIEGSVTYLSTDGGLAWREVAPRAAG